MKNSNEADKIPCLSLYSQASREEYIQHFMETLLEAVTAKPELSRRCLKIVCGAQWIVIEVDLDVFEPRQRARIIGTRGHMVRAMRKLLGAMCMYRKWRFQLHLSQDGESYPVENEKAIHNLADPEVSRIQLQQRVWSAS